MKKHEEQAFETLICYYNLIVKEKEDSSFVDHISWMIFGIVQIMKDQGIIDDEEFKRIKEVVRDFYKESLFNRN